MTDQMYNIYWRGKVWMAEEKNFDCGPFDKPLAEYLVEALNKKWTGLVHWMEPAQQDTGDEVCESDDGR